MGLPDWSQAATSADIADLGTKITTLNGNVLLLKDRLDTVITQTGDTDPASLGKKLDSVITQTGDVGAASLGVKLDTLLTYVTPINNDPQSSNVTILVTRTLIFDASGGSYSIVIQNTDTANRIRFGGTDITLLKGSIVKPGRYWAQTIKGIPVYGIAIDGASVPITLQVSQLT